MKKKLKRQKISSKRTAEDGVNLLWAPWRMKYIKNIKEKGCIFCKKLKNKNNESYIVKMKATCFSMLNIYPYNNGHLLVAPIRHVSKIESLNKKEILEIMELVVEMKKKMQKKMKPHGFNVGMNLGRCAGAGVPGHLHIHIVPRWDGDTNFMPIIGETKVLPQYLEDTYKLLQE